MAVIIEVTPTFLRNVRDVNFYLEMHFSISVAKKFQQKLDNRILSIKEFPFSGMTTLRTNIRMIIITKHNKLYYRVEQNTTVRILRLFDTRQNPEKNKFE